MKSVEVLLREHVGSLGKCGDVVRVKAGYARNFLFPQKLATRATEENKRLMERRRGRLDIEEAERNKEIDARVELLSAVTLKTAQKADENGHLYGSVNAAAVSGLLAAAGHTIPEKDVRIEAPIKTVGEHKVRVHVHEDRFAEVTLDVTAAEE